MYYILEITAFNSAMLMILIWQPLLYFKNLCVKRNIDNVLAVRQKCLSEESKEISGVLCSLLHLN